MWLCDKQHAFYLLLELVLKRKRNAALCLDNKVLCEIYAATDTDSVYFKDITPTSDKCRCGQRETSVVSSIMAVQILKIEAVTVQVFGHFPLK